MSSVKKVTLAYLKEDEKRVLQGLGKKAIFELKEIGKKYSGFEEVSKEREEYPSLYKRLQSLKNQLFGEEKGLREPERKLEDISYQELEKRIEALEKKVRTRGRLSGSERTKTGAMTRLEVLRELRKLVQRSAALKKGIEGGESLEKAISGAIADTKRDIKTLEELRGHVQRSPEFRDRLEGIALAEQGVVEAIDEAIEEAKGDIESLVELRDLVESSSKIERGSPSAELTEQEVGESIKDARSDVETLEKLKTLVQRLPQLREMLSGSELVEKEAAGAIDEVIEKMQSDVEGLEELKRYLQRSPEFRDRLEGIALAEQGVVEAIDEAIEEERKRLDRMEGEGWREEILKEISYLSAMTRFSHFLSKGKEKTLRGERVSVLQGWVPRSKLRVLKETLDAIKEETKGRLSVKIEDPELEEEVPTVKEPSKPFKAFGSLTRQYGVPTPKETDPTVFTAILWTVMFGFMFADWGEGLTLVFLGFLFVRMETSLMGFPSKKLGKLMIGCGIFATIFGLLTGEFFLLEAGAIFHHPFTFPFRPLWPGLQVGWATGSSNIIWLIKIAIFFGIIQLGMGILLSTKNHLAEGDITEALLGEGGVAGLLTLLSLALVAFKFFAPSGTGKYFVIIPGYFKLSGSGIMWPALTLGLGLVLIIGGAAMGEEGSLGLGLGILIETLIGFLSNMLSFIRLAGFLLLHVALALVVHELMAVGLGLGLGFLVLLNAFALTLEFLVVSIQALRLLFYEFFTKFFSGGGRLFKEYTFPKQLAEA